MKSYESHADHLKERVSSLERKLEESAEEKQRIMSNLKRKEAEEAITSDEIVADLKSQMHKEQLKLSRVGHKETPVGTPMWQAKKISSK